MAFSFFAIAVFLFLSLDSDYTTYPASAAKPEGVAITYGSVIKLMHERTKFRLHSHEVPYGSGSGQQSVTGFPNVDDSNSYWIVKPITDSTAKQGDKIKTGTIIRLQHMRTRRWLHSHLHASPMSSNLEVSCFGGDSESDTGDNWRLEIEGTGKIWRQDQRIRLHHVDTGGYLHSHDKKYSRIAGGQQEVCGVGEKRADNVWLAAEGVYLPVTESKFFDDLRPYGLVQFVPCIAILVMAILLPPMYTRSTYRLWAAGFYLLAKVEDAADKPIYNWLAILLVNTLFIKHLFVAMVPVFLTLMLAKRSIEPERRSLLQIWRISWTKVKEDGIKVESYTYTYTNVPGIVPPLINYLYFM